MKIIIAFLLLINCPQYFPDIESCCREVELYHVYRMNLKLGLLMIYIIVLCDLQTGSGKTFTVTGGAERYADRGIIPRSLSYIFDHYGKVMCSALMIPQRRAVGRFVCLLLHRLTVHHEVNLKIPKYLKYNEKTNAEALISLCLCSETTH